MENLLSDLNLSQMTKEQVFELINRRRRQCIVHRVLYYCYGESLVTDFQYDKWERELRDLTNKFPDIADEVPYTWLCPTKCVGSSNIDVYPNTFKAAARSLLAYQKDPVNPYTEKKVVEKAKPKLGFNTLFKMPLKK